MISLAARSLPTRLGDRPALPHRMDGTQPGLVASVTPAVLTRTGDATLRRRPAAHDIGRSAGVDRSNVTPVADQAHGLRPGGPRWRAAGPMRALRYYCDAELMTVLDDGEVTGIDDLYGLDPSAFTSARNALVRRLKAAGQRDEADTVAALRRPPATAWALNQVARQDPDLVATALTAGARLRDATEAALGGDASGLREASAEERTASEEVVAAATAHLGAGSAQVLPRLSATVHAAVLDEEVADQLRRGVLASDHDRSGLGLGADLESSPAPARKRHLRAVDPAPPRRARAAREPAVDALPAVDRDATPRRSVGQARREAEAQARLAAEEQARFEADERRHRRLVSELRNQATSASKRAERLGRKAEAAEASAAEARQEATDAARAAADAAQALAEADRPRGRRT